MTLLYKDTGKNKLYIKGKTVYARNAQNKLVDKAGVLTMLRRAKIPYKHVNGRLTIRR